METKGSREPKEYRTGYTDLAIRLVRDEQGWTYDGPASCGPRHVRLSGHGPYWRGPVSPQFAGVLIKRLRERGLLVEAN